MGLGLGIENKGLFEKLLEEKSLPYAPGDIFVFVSDGFTEGFNRQRNHFGEQRVLEYVRDHPEQSARQLRDGLIDELHYYTREISQHDDETIVVVKICEPDSSSETDTDQPQETS